MKLAALLLVGLVAASLRQTDGHRTRKKRQLPVIWQNLKNLPKDEIAASVKAIFDPNAKNGLDDRFLEMVNRFLQEPTLDPLHLPLTTFELDEEAAKMNLTLDGVTAIGMSAVKVTKLHVNILLLKAVFEVSLPSLLVRGHYDMNGLIGGVLPLYGKGPFEVNVTDAKASGTIKMGLKDGTLYIRTLDLDLGIGGVRVNVENVMEDADISKVVNDMINDLAPSMLLDNKRMIDEIAADRLMTMVNELLETRTMKEVADFVTGEAERAAEGKLSALEGEMVSTTTPTTATTTTTAGTTSGTTPVVIDEPTTDTVFTSSVQP